MKGIVVDYLPESFFEPFLFCQEECFENYKFLGAKCMEYKGLKGVSFSVWVPNANKVNLVGDFNSWDGSNYRMKKIDYLGIWNIFISGLNEVDIK